MSVYSAHLARSRCVEPAKLNSFPSRLISRCIATPLSLTHTTKLFWFELCRTRNVPCAFMHACACARTSMRAVWNIDEVWSDWVPTTRTVRCASDIASCKRRGPVVVRHASTQARGLCCQDKRYQSSRGTYEKSAIAAVDGKRTSDLGAWLEVKLNEGGQQMQAAASGVPKGTESVRTTSVKRSTESVRTTSVKRH
jgi:hypothetical protein